MDPNDGIGMKEVRKKLIVLLVCVIVIKFIQNYRTNSSIHKRISKYGCSDRAKYTRRIYSNDKSSIVMVRMNRSTFVHLVDIMRGRHLLHDTIHVSIEEQLVMFLHVVDHNKKNRVIGHNFMRSGATVSKYFGEVLRAIASLKDELMPPPDSALPNKIRNDSRMWPFFKDCIGAIDGTHILARVTSDIVARFRGRYKHPTQNVLAAIRFDRRFSYVLAGWEGSANDCTVLRNALEWPNGLRVPSGKYFLGDAGFFMKRGFLLPYRGMRYHRSDFSRDNPPRNAKELFNLRHSSLRSTIECTFGILKQRFRILDGYSHYSYRAQVALVLVCCLLHNFIMDLSPNDNIAGAVEQRYQQQNSRTRRENQNSTTHANQNSTGQGDQSSIYFQVRSSREMREENEAWRVFRDEIANQMWQRDYDVQ